MVARQSIAVVVTVPVAAVVKRLEGNISPFKGIRNISLFKSAIVGNVKDQIRQGCEDPVLHVSALVSVRGSNCLTSVYCPACGLSPE